MAGIQETKDVLVAANELALVIVSEVRDGVQADDVQKVIEKVMTSPAVTGAFQKAVQNVMAVPLELADISFFEGIELAQTQLAYVPKFIEAFKAPKKN